MKYMLLIYGAESCWTEQERRECMIESMEICERLAAEGKLIASAPLHSVSTATSLRVRDGKRLVTDGPFAETKEFLAGYSMIEADSLDEAVRMAEAWPWSRYGAVEVRPVRDFDAVRRRVGA